MGLAIIWHDSVDIHHKVRPYRRSSLGTCIEDMLGVFGSRVPVVVDLVEEVLVAYRLSSLQWHPFE